MKISSPTVWYLSKQLGTCNRNSTLFTFARCFTPFLMFRTYFASSCWIFFFSIAWDLYVSESDLNVAPLASLVYHRSIMIFVCYNFAVYNIPSAIRSLYLLSSSSESSSIINLCGRFLTGNTLLTHIFKRIYQITISNNTTLLDTTINIRSFFLCSFFFLENYIWKVRT